MSGRRSLPTEEWLAQHRPLLERCVREALDARDDERIPFVPREEEERRDGFSAWLARWRARLTPLIEERIRYALPELEHALGGRPVALFVGEHVWPMTERWLRESAIRGLAAQWVSHQFPDSTTIAWPVWKSDRWWVALGGVPPEEQIGHVILDADGNVLEDETVRGEDRLRPVGANPRSTPTAAGRQ